MMSLSDMADLVCRQLGRTDDDTVQLCKDFLRLRYRLVFDSHLWRDALHPGSVTADDGLNENIIVAPELIEHIIAVRRDPDANLSYEDVIETFLTNPAAFEEIGSPVKFSRLGPCGVAKFAGQQVKLRSSSSQDTGKQIRIREADGSTEETISIAPGKALANSAESYDYPIVSKVETTGSILVSRLTGSSGELVELGPRESARLYPRIKLLGDDEEWEDQTYLVLGKRRANDLVNDTDVPIISGCADVLIALASSDMLKRFRQYAKAELEKRDALVLLQKLKNLETAQTISNVRLIPSTGGEVCE